MRDGGRGGVEHDVAMPNTMYVLSLCPGMSLCEHVCECGWVGGESVGGWVVRVWVGGW